MLGDTENLEGIESDEKANVFGLPLELIPKLQTATQGQRVKWQAASRALSLEQSTAVGLVFDTISRRTRHTTNSSALEQMNSTHEQFSYYLCATYTLR